MLAWQKKSIVTHHDLLKIPSNQFLTALVQWIIMPAKG